MGTFKIYHSTKKKSKSLSQKDKEAKIRYEKWLEKKGLNNLNNLSDRKIYKPEKSESSHREKYPSLNESNMNNIGKSDERYKNEISSKYVIGQAYNKSGFQVLSKREKEDENTGKRR